MTVAQAKAAEAVKETRIERAICTFQCSAENVSQSVANLYDRMAALIVSGEDIIDNSSQFMFKPYGAVEERLLAGVIRITIATADLDSLGQKLTDNMPKCPPEPEKHVDGVAFDHSPLRIKNHLVCAEKAVRALEQSIGLVMTALRIIMDTSELDDALATALNDMKCLSSGIDLVDYVNSLDRRLTLVKVSLDYAADSL